MAMAAEKTAKQIQQEFAEEQTQEGSDLSQIYDENNVRTLLDLLTLLIPNAAGFGDKIRRKNNMLDRKRYSIAAALWKQKGAKLLFVNIIYVVCTKYNRNQVLAVDAIDHSTHIVFRVKKQHSLNTGYGYYHIFVDEHARVYQSWDDYVCNNCLPEGILVAPAGGFYDLDENNDVRLELAFTPATHNLFNNKEINKIAGILGLAAACATVISLVRPLPSCVMTVANAVGISVTLWSSSSKVLHLLDRQKHEQTICVLSEECSEIWLSLSSSILAIATRNANALLKNSVSLSSDVSWILLNTVNVLNVGTIAISLVNIYKNALKIINKRLNNRSVSPVDLLQLGVSAFLVTNAMYNFQSACRIFEIRRAQLKLENEMTISFDKASNELQHQENRVYDETDLNYSTKVNVDSLKTHPIVKQLIEDGLIPAKPNRQLRIEVAHQNNSVESSNIKLDSLPPKPSIQSRSSIPSLPKDQKPEKIDNSENSPTPLAETNTTTKTVLPAEHDSPSNINFWKIMNFAKVNSVHYYKACENMIRKYAMGDGQAESTDNKTETDSASSNESYSSYLSRIAGTCYNYSKYSASKCYEYSKGPIGYCYSGLKSFFTKPKKDD